MPELTSSSVETELNRLLAAGRLRASDYGEHYVALWDAFARSSSGGKRMRPALVLAAYSGLGGDDLELVTPVAVSFELLHTAFIIHDDVIDRDLTRRGMANVSGEFSSRALHNGASPDQAEVWAVTAGILAGDLALSEAHRAIALLPTDADTRGRLLDLLDRSVFISAAGERRVVHLPWRFWQQSQRPQRLGRRRVEQLRKPGHEEDPLRRACASSVLPWWRALKNCSSGRCQPAN